jgi:cystathionine beta-lyase/cystathionine gamma-synthase
MVERKLLSFIEDVLENVPYDWINLTTHRLDIYHEELAKTEFIHEFEKLYQANESDRDSLKSLPTAYDYIRLGHPLSSVLEWALAGLNGLSTDNVISFSSRTMPLMAVLRKNHFAGKKTRILYTDRLPQAFDEEIVKSVYGYRFESVQVSDLKNFSDFDGCTVFFLPEGKPGAIERNPQIDFYIGQYGNLGSVLFINGEKIPEYVSAIQHVRRRETIAMTPANCFTALQLLIGKSASERAKAEYETVKAKVIEEVRAITNTRSNVILGSSGLSVQYAIMMGLIEAAMKDHPGKAIKILIPPNCYGGTNDQARRVTACYENIEVLDLPVDRENDMVDSTNRVLDEVAAQDAVPLIIAEIPTNPRVEVPDLDGLQNALSTKRETSSGETAIAPIFILDQTFCPNVHFLNKGGVFAGVKAISYVSGSKFPSGGKCTAGYCVANENAEYLLKFIEKHILLCDNEANALQVEILAEQLPSMKRRIDEAYANTREFVNFIKDTLPSAKINFVTEELAKMGFKPSVFSLDLPTRGSTHEEREAHKRKLNNKLIDMMITEIPEDSKYCVSYGQLKGCYWTIPATSTQGTTKESDKDYIARVSVSPDLDLEKHKEVFKVFAEGI